MKYFVDYASDIRRELVIIEDGSFEQRYVYDTDGQRLSAEFSHSDGTARNTTNADGEYGENPASDFAVNDISKVWYRVNMLGTSLYAVDDGGEIIAHAEYDAWGLPLTETYTDTNYSGLESLTGYTGYVWDVTLKLHFAQNRFYDAETHRFTQEDPAKDGGNWYVYVGSNPLIATDPLGLLAEMKYGEGSPKDIREMQEVLYEMGFYKPEQSARRLNPVDGYWGLDTLEALIRFQLTFAGRKWEELFNPASDEYFGVGENTLRSLETAKATLSTVGNHMILRGYFQLLICADERVNTPLNYVTVSGGMVKRTDVDDKNSSVVLKYSGDWHTRSEAELRDHIWNYMRNKLNFSQELTAAFLGNIKHESQFSPTNAEDGKTDISGRKFPLGITHDPEYIPNYRPIKKGEEGDGIGWGLIQWTFSTRKYNLFEFAVVRNKGIGDFDMQLEFINHELTTGTESYVMRLIKNVSSNNTIDKIKQITKILFDKYEGPGDATLPKRQTDAVNYYKSYVKS
jgi:RHS repeat-associated protein